MELLWLGYGRALLTDLGLGVRMLSCGYEVFLAHGAIRAICFSSLLQ